MRNEFVFGTKNGNETKWYDISNLDRFDEILQEDNRLMWEYIQRHHVKEVVEIFTPTQRKDQSEPDMIKIATLPIEDAKRKFG